MKQLLGAARSASTEQEVGAFWQQVADDRGIETTPAKRRKLDQAEPSLLQVSPSGLDKSPKAVTPFDDVADVAQGRLTMRRHVEALIVDVDGLEKQMMELVESLESDTSDAYDDTMPGMMQRLECLRNVKGLSSEDFVKCKESAITDKDNTPLPMALALFEKLACVADIQKQFGNFGGSATSHEELAAEMKSLQANIDNIRLLMSSAKRLLVVTGSIRTTREREAVNAEQSRVKALAKAAVVAAKQAVGKKEGAAVPKLPGCLSGEPSSAKFWELRFDSAQMQVFEVGSLAKDLDFSKPWVQHASEVASRTLNGSPCRLNLMVFKAGFLKTKPPIRRFHNVPWSSEQFIFAVVVDCQRRCDGLSCMSCPVCVHDSSGRVFVRGHRVFV
jgi:hypothetical protein